MTAAQTAALAVGALLVFWILGAHNRLVGLRNAIVDAWKQVADAIARRGDAVQALAAVWPGGEGVALLAGQGRVQAAAAAIGAHPVVSAAAAAALADAEAAFAAAAAAVTGPVLDAPAVAPHVVQIAEAAARLDFARRLYNDAAARYDDALAQFPTRLLTPMFGFGPAGRL